ncbi:hypothetical protein ACPOL_4323 [Acidisarcina polymorpha]|uniref:Peptidase S24/S26A/S26B/S26C domain-containing protein n=1 Tax=Acidisarcina polymorpha TaxID=2211140 RepID=A0A2Z5G3B0_9BACT|nr:hypothetical protein [Acidisarcina polymorpha]AXC13598.1 hypothetical protein ACPOL_4323 [Acidisarcina polymorpha]
MSREHISNFLRRKRGLSPGTADKFMGALGLTVADLTREGKPDLTENRPQLPPASFRSVPLVNSATALHDPQLSSRVTLDFIPIRKGLLEALRDKCSSTRRRQWERFVAVQIGEEDARFMQPKIPARAIVLLDRHYTSAIGYSPNERTVYAVQVKGVLAFRYLQQTGRQLLLSGDNSAYVPTLLPFGAGQAAGDLIVGRVFLVLSET